MNKNYLIKKPILISVISIVVIFLSINYINLKVNLNVGSDLTESKTFSVSAGTKSVLKNIPLGRIGSESDIATAVVYLASNASSMITGSSLVIDGGWTAR